MSRHNKIRAQRANARRAQSERNQKGMRIAGLDPQPKEQKASPYRPPVYDYYVNSTAQGKREKAPKLTDDNLLSATIAAVTAIKTLSRTRNRGHR